MSFSLLDRQGTPLERPAAAFVAYAGCFRYVLSAVDGGWLYTETPHLATPLTVEQQWLFYRTVREAKLLPGFCPWNARLPELPRVSTCQHAPYEDCLICRECGNCDETLNDDDVCSDCLLRAGAENLRTTAREFYDLFQDYINHDDYELPDSSELRDALIKVGESFEDEDEEEA